MRASLVLALVCALATPALAQPPGKFPPDSLVNVKVVPRNTPVAQLVGTMRDFTSALGVRCTYCHVGSEEIPLSQYDFASDEKRTKRVARQMMLMVQEVNRRLDTIPEPGTPAIDVTCLTCHRGASRPVPLHTLIAATATTAGADSAIKTYMSLRERHYGRDAYDFGERSLNTAALDIARAGKTNEALALLRLNQEQFPDAVSVHLFRGAVQLMRNDTTAAAEAYREALERDPQNREASQRLRAIGRQP